MRKLDVLAAALVIIGALNWGLAGVFHVDLVAVVFGLKFGETSPLSTVVYSLVGLAGCIRPWHGKRFSAGGMAISPKPGRSHSEKGRRVIRRKENDTLLAHFAGRRFGDDDCLIYSLGR